MAVSRNVNSIILSLIDYLRTVQPDLDVKPGTVARDLFVDAPSIELASLYEELSLASNKQSITNVVEGDLDKLVSNYGVVRKQALQSSGTALFTFSSLNANVAISKGNLVFSKSGSSYEILSNVSINSGSSNFYKSIATKYKNDLDFLNIKDIYAVEVPIKATTGGTSGNISKYGIINTNIPGVSNVTNVTAISNGVDKEDDVSLKNRFLAALRGSSVGTALGYKTAAVSVSGVSDAVVIEPGDPLMQRDGTSVLKNTDGSFTILSEGNGGKVDVIILGSSLQENIDTFIYKDKSNTGNAFDAKNNFVLGQIAGDENKTILRKRIDNITAGTLPAQPVDSFLEVTGSLSGGNFKEKSVDIYGRVTGNYELIKDTGVYAGSPFGFDTFSWVSNKVSGYQEDKIKGQINGQDTTVFSDITKISNAQQNVSITNENSNVTSDKSIIQLLHTPSINVTRVYNVTTGERYVVTNQNIDGTTLLNTSGRIKISGSNLPSSTDVLQVDYSWVVSYDSHSDYDGKEDTNNQRQSGDTIDWSYTNSIKKEFATLLKDSTNNYYYADLLFPINSVTSINGYESVDGYVELITSGIYSNRLAVKLFNLSSEITNVYDIKLKNTNTSIINSSDSDLVFENTFSIVGLELRYNTTIILPTDTNALINNVVSVNYNYSDFSLNCSFNGNRITVPENNFNDLHSSYDVEVNYIANLFVVDNFNANVLPSLKFGNSYVKGLSSTLIDESLSSFKKQNATVSLNGFAQTIVDTGLSTSDFILTKDDIISVTRLYDELELFDGYVGSIISSGATYQIVLTKNTPVVGNKTLILFKNKELNKFQPFLYQSTSISKYFDRIKTDGVDGYVFAHHFFNDTSLSCDVVGATNSNIYASFSDGYIVSDDTTTFSLYTATNLSSIIDVQNKKIKIKNSIYPSNNGIFDIKSYSVGLNKIVCKLELSNIDISQVSVTRIQDGKELVVKSILNNKIKLDGVFSLNDYCFINVSLNKAIKTTATRIACSISDQNNVQGSLLFKGTTLIKFEDLVYTSTNSGLKQNITEIAKQILGLSSASQVPSSIYLSKLIKAEKVTTINQTSNEVISVLNKYYINSVSLKNNEMYFESLKNDNLSNLEFELSDSLVNTLNTEETSYLPQIGDRIRVTGYLAIPNDSEQLNYSKAGTNYTNKKFATIDSVLSLSGLNSQTTKIVLSSFNQPTSGARYKATYDYIAPKINERINIRYNYNKTISDATFAIELVRPINADVIVKSANAINVDVTINIVLQSNFINSSNTVKQNVQDVVTNLINQNVLNSIIDSSDIVNETYSVSGVDRARVIYFNKSGDSGQKLSLSAQKNEYFKANNIIVNVETR